VCAPAKGGLRDFVTPELTLDESDPVWSLRAILVRILDTGMPVLQDVSDFGHVQWEQRLTELIDKSQSILILHDYQEKIWGAEYYVDSLMTSLKARRKRVEYFGHTGHTTPWKRRIMFVLSIFAFWRGIELYAMLQKIQPDTIWMHSVLRYIGPWGVLAVCIYCSKYGKHDLRDSNWDTSPSSLLPPTSYISHHDLGLLAAFPQDITAESDIPMNPSLRDFIPKKGILKQFISIGKWCYVRIITLILPDDTTHVIFAPFLEVNIRGQFGNDKKIQIFPHQSIVGTSSSRGV
jgi:hypothetical protein